MQRLDQRRAAEFEAEGSAEAGFTLIELMVVLLILAILLAIAIPTFLGVTGSANDRAAQSNLNTGLTNAKSIYQQSNQAYPGGVPAAEPLAATIATNEPSLPMTTGTSVGVGFVAAFTDTGTTTAGVQSYNPNGAILFALAKKTGECWWVADNTGSMAASGATPLALAPWLATANNGATPTTAPTTEAATKGGVPLTPGIIYGVYVLKTGQLTCDTTVLGATTTLSTISSTAFPPAQ
jgi:type IV pilus assembly protein PilA